MRAAFRSLFLGLLGTALGSSVAGASTIFYTAVDLPDRVPGADRWRYDYSVESHSTNRIWGFSLFYDYAVYEFRTVEADPPLLEIDPADYTVEPGWDPATAPPSTYVGGTDPGVFDLVDYSGSGFLPGSPPLGGFSITFVYRGAGAPGPQAFSTYSYDPIAMKNVTESSFTQPLPEPGRGLFLAVTGALLLLVSRARRNRQVSSRPSSLKATVSS